MTADSWAMCPRCHNDALTVGEDSEIGIDQAGEFYVFYHGECSSCDFVYVFKHTEDLLET